MAPGTQLFDRRPIMQKSRLDRIASPSIVQEKVAGWITSVGGVDLAGLLCIQLGLGHKAVKAQSFQRRRANLLHGVFEPR
jgi:hypothetical protein